MKITPIKTQPQKATPAPKKIVAPIPVKKSNKKLIIIISLILFFVLAVAASVAFFLSKYNQIVVKPDAPKPQAQATATPTPDPDRPFSILLLGYGGANHDGGRLTDSIIVAQIEPKKARVNLISVPRDLWVNLPIYEDKDFYSKINAAYVIGSDDRNYTQKVSQYTGKSGGGELAKKVIGDVVGFPIDYYVSIDFSGFVKAIDLLDGVDVTVDRSFDDYQYPIEGMEDDLCGFNEETITAMESTMSGLKLEQAFTCRYEHLHFDKGVTHMDGTTALKYVRSRHSATDGGDFNRSSRQRNLIIAVKNKIFSIGFLQKIIPSLNLMVSHVQTDIDLNSMEAMISRASDSGESYSIINTPITEDNVLKQGRSDDGQFILMPRIGIGQYDQIHQYIIDPNSLTPTPTPTSALQ